MVPDVMQSSINRTELFLMFSPSRRPSGQEAGGQDLREKVPGDLIGDGTRGPFDESPESTANQTMASR